MFAIPGGSGYNEKKTSKEEKKMEFNAKEQLTGLIEWMRERMAACGGKTAVIGISGGKDSSVESLPK